MEQQLNTYYIGYRGIITLHTQVQAESEDAAVELMRDMPSQPTADMDLKLHYSDFDFELDDYIATESDAKYWTYPPSKALSKQIIKTAHNQAQLRLDARKQRQIESVTKSIADAQAQLLTATKGITDQIDKLNTELWELKK